MVKTVKNNHKNYKHESYQNQNSHPPDGLLELPGGDAGHAEPAVPAGQLADDADYGGSSAQHILPGIYPEWHAWGPSNFHW